jgi:hypothetical protein
VKKLLQRLFSLSSLRREERAGERRAVLSPQPIFSHLQGEGGIHFQLHEYGWLQPLSGSGRSADIPVRSNV